MSVAKKRDGMTPRKTAEPMTSEAAETDAISELSPETETGAGEDIPAEQYQRYAVKVISTNFVHILDKMAKKSVEGSLPHTKYLFEIGGLKEIIERLGQEAEPSLADLLEKEIQKQRAAVEERRREAAQRIAEFGARTDRAEESGAECGARPQ